MSFWDGLQETILAGVDGYVRIETAKNQQTEATPPTPDPTRYDQWEQTGNSGGPGMVNTLANNSSWLLMGSGLLLAVALILKD